MKHIFLAVLTLLALSTLASAQAVDPAIQAAVEAAVPAQYAGYTSLALIALMMLGRWIKALQNGTGIKGWFSAIWFGTNTPKLIIAGLCLLSLPSCATRADGTRTFAGLSLPEGLQVGERLLRRQAKEDPRLLKVVEIIDDAKAVTSAKQPVDVRP